MGLNTEMHRIRKTTTLNVWIASSKLLTFAACCRISNGTVCCTYAGQVASVAGEAGALQVGFQAERFRCCLVLVGYL